MYCYLLFLQKLQLFLFMCMLCIAVLQIVQDLNTITLDLHFSSILLCEYPAYSAFINVPCNTLNLFTSFMATYYSLTINCLQCTFSKKTQVSAKQNCSWSNKKKENAAGPGNNEAKHLLKLVIIQGFFLGFLVQTSLQTF